MTGRGLSPADPRCPPLDALRVLTLPYAGFDDVTHVGELVVARVVADEVVSHHALGLAIDINPRENPMILRGVVHPPSALPYVDRAHVRPGMIVPGSVVHDTFLALGWHWGGAWGDLPDYHHFSRWPRGATSWH